MWLPKIRDNKSVIIIFWLFLNHVLLHATWKPLQWLAPHSRTGFHAICNMSCLYFPFLYFASSLRPFCWIARSCVIKSGVLLLLKRCYKNKNLQLQFNNDSFSHRDNKTKFTHQFGKFWRPCVRGDDLIARHPVFIDGAEVSDRLMTCLRLFSANQNPVRVQKVLDGSSLGKKLRIWQNLSTA